MENHHFLWEHQLQMAFFNSYVSLLEGTVVTVPEMYPTDVAQG